MSKGQVLGYDEAGRGDVLLLIHGFPLDSSIWNAQLSALSQLRRVVAVDLRGRRKSQSIDPRDSTIDLYAHDVAATIRALGEDPVDLAGLSLGGYVCFSAMRQTPGLVRRLILIDTKAEADSQEAKQNREKSAALVREQGTAALIDALLPALLAPGTGEETRSNVRRLFEEMPAETAAADLMAMKDRADSTGDLPGITVPTLVVQGEQDQLMPIQGARMMAEAIPGARFVAIGDAGHLAPLENPDAVNAAISDFLGG